MQEDEEPTLGSAAHLSSQPAPHHVAEKHAERGQSDAGARAARQEVLVLSGCQEALREGSSLS